MRRLSIRILVVLTLCAAFAAFVFVPIPENANGHPALPAVALEQESLYRLEISLMVFYGGLLLITPAFSGLVAGRLPVEISARGAKFAEEADQSTEIAASAIRNLEETTDSLSETVAAALSRIERLEQSPVRDNTQPEVDSQL
jgi:hypothetical protein